MDSQIVKRLYFDKREKYWRKIYERMNINIPEF